MATIENTIDRLLVATPDQAEPGGDGETRTLLLTSSSPGGFKVSPGGTLSPVAITFEAIPIGMDGAIVQWITDGGANITFTGNTAQLAAQDMELDKAVITATVTFEGATYQRDITVQTVQDGTVGSTTYTWIRYADSSTGAGISNDPTNKSYIGFAYNKSTANESNDPTQYAWSLIKGEDAIGTPGKDGQTYWTWVKYSDNADGTGLYDVPTATTEYIGIAVNRTVQTESTVKTDYVWSKFKGDKGVPGDPGAVSYVWMKYADNAQGAGMSDDGAGKLYIGIAYNKSTPNESTNPADYTWTLIKGEPGVGVKGDPGSSLYTWLKYSDSADGSNPYDIPNDNTLYVGIAVNKTTATESTNKADYTWSRFRGSDGVSVPGSRGAGFYRTTGSAWSDATADAATPGGNVIGDIVTISNGTVSYTREWNGSAWFVPGAFLSGSLFVEKSITAAQINSNGLEIYKPDGTPILTLGGLQPGFEAPGTKNSEIKIGGRNLYRKTSPFGNLGTGASLTSRLSTGFQLRGTLANNGAMRLGQVIPSNGTFTISFDLAVATAGGFALAVGFTAAEEWLIVPTTTAQHFSRTFTVSNWSADTFNFIDFSRLSDQPYNFTNFNVEAGNKETAYTPAPEDVDSDISAAKAAADAANARIASISADGKLDRSEKPDVVQQWNAIAGEVNLIINQATALDVASTNYLAYYNALESYLVGLGPNSEWSNTAVDTNIVRDTFNAKFTEYRTAKQSLLNAIAAKIQSNAAAAQGTANSAVNGLAAKLDAAGNQILRGPIALQDAGAIVIGTTDNGTVMSATGFATRFQGVTKFTLPIAGNPTFGGELTAPSGSIGSITLAANGHVKTANMTGWGVWPASGQTCAWFGPEGIMLGNWRDGRFLHAYGNGDLFMPGFEHSGGQLKLTNTVIVNPDIQQAQLGMTGVPSSINGGSSLPHDTVWRVYGSFTITPTNVQGSAVVDAFINVTEGEVRIYQNGNTVTVSGRGKTGTEGTAGRSNAATIIITAVDSNNRTATRRVTVVGSHGVIQ